MTITYYLHPSEEENLKDAILNSVDMGDLRYYHGWGHITLFCEVAQEHKLTLNVPVLDFALSLLHVVNDLHSKDMVELDFTESDAKLIFMRTENIIITSNFSEWSCVCSLSQLDAEAKSFYTNMMHELDLPTSIQNKMSL